MKGKYPGSNFPVHRYKTRLHISAKRRREFMTVLQFPPFAAVQRVEQISLGSFVLRETQRISQVPCEEMNIRGATSHLMPAQLMGEVPPLRRFFDSWFSGPAERRKVTVAREEEDHMPILLRDAEEKWVRWRVGLGHRPLSVQGKWKPPDAPQYKCLLLYVVGGNSISAIVYVVL